MHSRLARHLAVLAVVGTAAAVYLALRADRGWIPHDEGTLGQAAVRLLEGELPHRDFDDPYTGGLSFLHAAAFRIVGLRLTSLRLVLLVFSLGFVAAVYRIAARAGPPAAAALATLLCVAWTVPNYFASLPSWYNEFFAVFGILALDRFLASDRRRWLFVAGLCGGASFAVKSVGLYFVAATLLVLVHHEQLGAAAGGDRGPTRAFRLFVAAGLSGFAGLLVLLVRPRAAPMELLHFVVPGLALAAYLIWNESRLDAAGEGVRWRRLVALVAPFAAGVALPVGVLLLPYVAGGGLGALLEGVFVTPQRRLLYATDPLPPLSTLAAALPLGTLLVVATRRRRPAGAAWLVAVVALVLGAVLAFGGRLAVYRAVWFSVRPALPLVVLAGVAQLVRVRRDERLFLLLAVAAMVGLVQFPNAFGLYFCYAAAPLILAAQLLLAPDREQDNGRRGLVCGLTLALASFYLLFALVWMHPADFRQMGVEYRPVVQDALLDLPRGGLYLERGWVEIYRPLVDEVRRHSEPGAYIYAFGDCPEVYFLSERRNPTRVFFDFFEQEPERAAERTVALLDEHRVEVVVVNRASNFSKSIPRALVRAIDERFPGRATIGHFLVAWRDLAP